uniref:Uncharacterized protein n=1 Tax=Heterorhabditis bacteriophora TaxID=37862 RepID=A0A1I7WE21_HETBA
MANIDCPYLWGPQTVSPNPKSSVGLCEIKESSVAILFAYHVC